MLPHIPSPFLVSKVAMTVFLFVFHSANYVQEQWKKITCQIYNLLYIYTHITIYTYVDMSIDIDI